MDILPPLRKHIQFPYPSSSPLVLCTKKTIVSTWGLLVLFFSSTANLDYPWVVVVPGGEFLNLGLFLKECVPLKVSLHSQGEGETAPDETWVCPR